MIRAMGGGGRGEGWAPPSITQKSSNLNGHRQKTKKMKKWPQMAQTKTSCSITGKIVRACVPDLIIVTRGRRKKNEFSLHAAGKKKKHLKK